MDVRTGKDLQEKPSKIEIILVTGDIILSLKRLLLIIMIAVTRKFFFGQHFGNQQKVVTIGDQPSAVEKFGMNYISFQSLDYQISI